MGQVLQYDCPCASFPSCSESYTGTCSRPSSSLALLCCEPSDSQASWGLFVSLAVALGSASGSTGLSTSHYSGASTVRSYLLSFCALFPLSLLLCSPLYLLSPLQPTLLPFTAGCPGISDRAASWLHPMPSVLVLSRAWLLLSTFALPVLLGFLLPEASPGYCPPRPLPPSAPPHSLPSPSRPLLWRETGMDGPETCSGGPEGVRSQPLQ